MACPLPYYSGDVSVTPPCDDLRRDGIDCLCCGAGPEVLPVKAVEGTLFCLAWTGFAALRSEPDALTFEFRDFAGMSLYRSTIPRGSRTSPRAS